MATSSWRRRINGSIEIVQLKKCAGWAKEFSDAVESYCRYIWRPPYQILDKLPEWYELALDCCTINGVRRFTPIHLAGGDRRGLRFVSDVQGMSLVASVGGHCLLLDRGKVSNKSLLTHHESRLYFQYIEHRREYFGPRKAFDLKVARAKSGFQGATVLPKWLGLGPDHRGKSWTKSRLDQHGRSAAMAAGIEKPTDRQIQSYGLLEAAKLDPLELRSADEIKSIVRMTLFALLPGEKPTKPQLKYVAALVRESLSQRLNDTDEEFRKWILDPDSNLLHRISKRKDCKMSREQVKRVLLELGWLSLQMLGKCIDVQMRAFRDAIPQPLSEIENFYYGEAFLAKEVYAGLPLVLLHDHFAELQPAIVNVWNNPGDRPAIAVLHRAMAYWSVIRGNRRHADNQYKRPSLVRYKKSQIEGASSDASNGLPSKSSGQDGLFLEVAKRLARKHGIDCDIGEWEAALDDSENDSFCIELRRDEPPFATKIKTTLTEFKAIAKEIRNAD